MHFTSFNITYSRNMSYLSDIRFPVVLQKLLTTIAILILFRITFYYYEMRGVHFRKSYIELIKHWYRCRDECKKSKR